MHPRSAMVRDITLQGILEVLGNGTDTMVFVDVSPVESYDELHILKSIHLPPEEHGEARIVLPSLAIPILLHGRGPEDAEKVRRLARGLDEQGFSDVFAFAGGLAEWRAAGLPTESVPGGTRRAS